ncbi:Uncharacterised protein [Pseudomonas aeruginosa]|nr:Uncharacterised protein [Pseudomonas aeruginosa]
MSARAWKDPTLPIPCNPVVMNPGSARMGGAYLQGGRKALPVRSEQLLWLWKQSGRKRNRGARSRALFGEACSKPGVPGRTRSAYHRHSWANHDPRFLPGQIFASGGVSPFGGQAAQQGLSHFRVASKLPTNWAERLLVVETHMGQGGRQVAVFYVCVLAGRRICDVSHRFSSLGGGSFCGFTYSRASEGAASTSKYKSGSCRTVIHQSIALILMACAQWRCFPSLCSMPSRKCSVE